MKGTKRKHRLRCSGMAVSPHRNIQSGVNIFSAISLISFPCLFDYIRQRVEGIVPNNNKKRKLCLMFHFSRSIFMRIMGCYFKCFYLCR